MLLLIRVLFAFIVFIVTFLAYLVILKKFLIMFFEVFICLRNLSRLCFFKILHFLLHIRIYVAYSLEVRHCQRNFLISLIIFVHFVIYSSLIFSYNFAHKIKSSIVFFKALNNFVVYLLMLSFLIESFNINLSNKFLNMSSNLFKFIVF